MMSNSEFVPCMKKEDGVVYELIIAFGHRRSDGSALPSHLIDEMKQLGLVRLGELFGGGAHELLDGSYKSYLGKVLLEPSSWLMTFTDEITEDRWERLEEVIKEIGETLDQESVSVTLLRLPGVSFLMQMETRPETTLEVSFTRLAQRAILD